MLDILLPSMYFCDLVFTGLPEMPRLGNETYCKNLKVIPGGGFIPALALSRLDLKVGWACDFGNDFFSCFALEQARQQNLCDRLFRIHDFPIQSVTVSFSFSHERAFLTYLDPLPPFDLPALIRENPARCLMLMGLSSGPDFHKTVAAAREIGALIFMECQATDASLDAPQVAEALKVVDIFAPNQEEALRLTGEKTVEAALERLAALTPTVVIKQGADGAIAQQNGERVRLPGMPFVVKDTTGAGDNFDCGFVYGVLQGYSLEDSLRCGNYCGGLSTTACGGWEASPTVAQLEDWLAGQRS